MPDLAAHVSGRLGTLLGPDFPSQIGLAVSGGGDSMAMLHLVAGWARPMGIGLRVATVDHGLRPESTSEAALVADEAAGLGLPHETLHWAGREHSGNLMEAARNARLALIDDWRGDIRHVLFAHTRDDVAETFLMRLERGSGVDGLSSMAPTREVQGARGPWVQVRPLLEVSRADLRRHNRVLKIPFVDDPTNDDTAFLRTRMRQVLGPLSEAGITVEMLAETAGALARAREALETRAHNVARRLRRDGGSLGRGDVWLDRDGLSEVEEETRLRIFARSLQFVAGNPMRPRLSAVEGALEAVLSGGTITLHGAMAVPRGDTVFIFREARAVAQSVTRLGDGQLWDGRWEISGPAELEGLEIRALGEAGVAAAGRPDHPLPRDALRARPALFDGESLLACPALEVGPTLFLTDRTKVPAPGSDG